MMNIYGIPTYLGNNDEVFEAYPRRADTLDVYVDCILLVITRSTKEKGVDKHRFFKIEIGQSYLQTVIPIRFSWVTHTLLQTSFVRGFEAPATDVNEPGK